MQGPYKIHEAPVQHLWRCIHKLLADLLLASDKDITWSTHLNLTITSKNLTIIHDLHLDLRLRHPRGACIPFQVIECGFSSEQELMEVECLMLQSAQTMETVGADSLRTNRFRTECESAFFPARWSILLSDLQDSIYDAAYSRSCDWREEPKWKANHAVTRGEPGRANKRLASSAPSRTVRQNVTTQAAKKRGEKKGKPRK